MWKNLRNEKEQNGTGKTEKRKGSWSLVPVPVSQFSESPMNSFSILFMISNFINQNLPNGVHQFMNDCLMENTCSDCVWLEHHHILACFSPHHCVAAEFRNLWTTWAKNWGFSRRPFRLMRDYAIVGESENRWQTAFCCLLPTFPVQPLEKLFWQLIFAYFSAK